MDAGHDKVEASQDVVRIVERAIRKDVGLDPLEDAEFPAVLLVEPVGFGLLLLDLLHREAAGVVRGLGMVRDAEIFVAALARRLRHLLQRVDAVRALGVRVQDPADVPVLDQLRQVAGGRDLNLAAAFAELRLDELQTERLVDRGFGFRGDDLVSSTQTVFGDFETFDLCQLAQLIQMGRVTRSRGAA